jgi:hypothetical protein
MIRKVLSRILLLTLTLTLITPSAKGSSAVDCLTHRLRTLIARQSPETVLNFEQKIAKTMEGRPPQVIEAELFEILEEFSMAHPSFPKEDFKAWMQSKPLTSWDIEQATKLNANQGNILDYRFQIFKLEQETKVQAQKIGQEIHDAITSCEKNPECSKLKTQGIFKKHFSCTLNDKRVQSSLLSSILVQNGTYLISAGTTDHPVAWDLAVTNGIFAPILAERYCRRSLGRNPEHQPSFREQYRNLFLGRKDEFGVRPGFLRTVASLEWELIKMNAWWALGYKGANTLTETTIRGKKITLSPLSDLPESERKNYVTLDPLSVAKESGQILFFFDLPFSAQRNIFISSHLYTIALPHIIKSRALLFASQTGVRTGFGVFSTLFFQCWNEAGRSYNDHFWKCVKHKENDNPEFKVDAIESPKKN